METTTLVVNPKEFGLEENKALELTSGLTTILTERETLKNAYLDVIDLDITEENLPTFKELRLKIVKNRTQGIEKWHKTTKDFFLTGGRFVDSVKNKEVFENERMEKALLEKEKHFENLEKERLKAIHNERAAKLIPFNYEIGNVDFSGMDENMFNAILLGAETNHKAILEAARLSEEAKKEKDERLDKLFKMGLKFNGESLTFKNDFGYIYFHHTDVLCMDKEKFDSEYEKSKELKAKWELQQIEKDKADAEAVENLRKENEEKEKQIKEDKAKADAELSEQKRLADIEAKKQAEIIAKQKAEADKLAAQLKAKADAELKEKQRIEAENKAKLEAEKKAAKAPDKDKLLALINSMSFNNVDLKSQDSLALQNLINQRFDGFKKWAIEQINGL